MVTRQVNPPITCVQVVIVRKDGDKETRKSVDIPIKDDSLVDIDLDADETGIRLHVDVPTQGQYTISYVLRDQSQMVDPETPLTPYKDGIYSSADVAGIKAEMEFHHNIQIDILEKKLKRRDKALRALRREKAERRRLQI